MKKIFTFMVIALCAMTVVSCKNANNNEAAAEEATECCAEGECCGKCEEGECAACDSCACAKEAADKVAE